MKVQITTVAEWLTRASIGLVVLGALFGGGALIWPLQTPGAISLGLALWSLAAVLKIASIYALGVPLLDLTRVMQGHEGASIQRRGNPVRYHLYHLTPLVFLTLVFAVLLKFAVDAFRGQLL
jgi:hypothetical protein